jgi:excisionase family DNA binding protein
MPATALLPAEFWTRERLRDYLGLTDRAIYHLTHTHQIGFIKVGKELRFDPAEVAAYLERQTSRPTPASPEPPPRKRGRPRKTIESFR